MLAMPKSGLIRGQAVLIDLDGARIEAMLVKSPAAIVAELSVRPRKEPRAGAAPVQRRGCGACSTMRVSTRRAD